MKNAMKKLLLVLAIAGVVVLGGCGKTGTELADQVHETVLDSNTDAASQTEENEGKSDVEENADGEVSQNESDFTAFDVDFMAGELLSGLHHVEIHVKDYGTIKVELDADTAPISATNFVYLANQGFYDGLTFHRIISGFMIQGGDPLGNGTGGADYNIKGEFSANGVENNISHKRGVISMARSQMNDSASSQFFIMHQDGDYLDGQYAAFGHVTEGMEIVDAICQDTPVQDNNGTVLPADQPVIESVTVID